MTVERLALLLMICTPLTIVVVGLTITSATGDLARLFHRTPTGRHTLTDRPKPRPHSRPAT